MTNDFFHPAFAYFVRDSIGSIEQLEVLLLLRNSKTPLTVGEIQLRMRSNPESIKTRLESLASKGLVLANEAGEYFYSPSSEDLERLVSELVEVYLIRRFSLINLLYGGTPGQEIADAFVFRGGGSRGRGRS